MVKKHQPSNETCIRSGRMLVGVVRQSCAVWNSRLASPVCEGRCTICVQFPAQPV